MYIPSSFRQDDPELLRCFLQDHSFATLVSQHQGALEATQIPFLLELDSSGQVTRLLGHLARANRQWERADGTEVLVLFQGPHAYISPTWYDAQNSVPTWNYVSVQVKGTLRVIQDTPRLLDLLGRMVQFYEQGQPVPWTMELPEPGYLDQLTRSIVGFEIPIQSISGKWKLGQNHDPVKRQRVIDALRCSAEPMDRVVAELMQSTLDEG